MYSAGHTFFLVYTIAISLFAAAVLVQFVRKRKSVYLKDRFPNVSLLQLAAGAVGWIAFAVEVLAQSVRVRCVADLVVSILAANVVFLAMFIRIWGLFWRIYLGKYLAESRKRLHEELSLHTSNEGSRRSLHSQQHHRRASVSQTATCCWCCKCGSKKQLLQFMKYSLPLVFGALVLSHTLASIVSVSALNVCDTYREKFSTVQLLVVPIVTVVYVLAAAIAFSIRKFDDNVGVNTEIKRLFVVQISFSPVMIGLLAAQQAIGGMYDMPYIAASLFLQLIFIVSGYFPLRDQRRLEQKVQSSDFGDLTSFESVLHGDAAALVAFERFMRREFCEEMLEFSKAVTRYTNKHPLSTRERQLSMARVIFAQFVAADAPAQINVSATCLEKITRTLFDAAGVTRLGPGVEMRHAPIDVFDEAQAEMHKLIREGPFIRFQIRDTAQDLASKQPKHEDTLKATRQTGSMSRSVRGVGPSDSSDACAKSV